MPDSFHRHGHILNLKVSSSYSLANLRPCHIAKLVFHYWKHACGTCWAYVLPRNAKPLSILMQCFKLSVSHVGVLYSKLWQVKVEQSETKQMELGIKLYWWWWTYGIPHQINQAHLHGAENEVLNTCTNFGIADTVTGMLQLLNNK